MFFPANKYIGLDIQANHINLMILRKKNACMYFDCVAQEALPNNIFAEGRIKEWHYLSEILSLMVHSLKIKSKSVAIAIPNNLVKCETIVLPLGMSDREIEFNIRQQLQRSYFNSSEHLAIDYVKVSKLTHDLETKFLFR